MRRYLSGACVGGGGRERERATAPVRCLVHGACSALTLPDACVRVRVRVRVRVQGAFAAPTRQQDGASGVGGADAEASTRAPSIGGAKVAVPPRAPCTDVVPCTGGKDGHGHGDEDDDNEGNRWRQKKENKKMQNWRSLWDSLVK